MICEALLNIVEDWNSSVLDVFYGYPFFMAISDKEYPGLIMLRRVKMALQFIPMGWLPLARHCFAARITDMSERLNGDRTQG